MRPFLQLAIIFILLVLVDVVVLWRLVPHESVPLVVSLFVVDVLFVGAFVWGMWIRPLRQIARFARDLAHGDLSTHREMKNEKEFEEVFSSLRYIAERQSAVRKGVEEKVRQRTLAIAEEEEKLRILLDNLPAGVVMASSPDGKILSTNALGLEFAGLGTDSRIRKERFIEVTKVLREDGTPYPLDELPATVTLTTGKRSEKDDIYFRRDDGSIIGLRSISVPVHNSDGKVILVITVFYDVTKEREIDHAKSEFISLAAHQLRTPLATIHWYAELLDSKENGTLSEVQSKFLDEIIQGGNRMITLVNDLLDISRFEMGTLMAQGKDVDLVTIIDGILKDLSGPLGAKNIHIQKDFDPALPTIHSDPRLVRVVLQNILTNAMQYSYEGKSIELAMKQVDDEVVISVKDYGYGIPLEAQSKIFGKFFRAENAREVETNGTGLGLYIVRSLLGKIHGKIWFQSKEGEGSTFYVALPVHQAGLEVPQRTLSELDRVIAT